MRNNNSLPRKKRHRKIMKLARGYFGSRSKHFRSANEAVVHAMENRTISRKIIKRDMRRTWITRINSFVRTRFGITYSQFIHLLKKNEVSMNRKIISDMIVTEEEKTINYFKSFVYGDRNE